MGTAYDVIGMIGTFIISAGLVPQLTKVFRTKRADDLSYTFLCLYVTGVALVSTYGLGEGLWPIYIPNLIELVAAISLLGMKIRYSGNSSEESKAPHGDFEVALSPVP